MKLIAETAWHHEGDYEFMKNLVTEISSKTEADIVKLHITLDFDEYMDSSHDAYSLFTINVIFQPLHLIFNYPEIKNNLLKSIERLDGHEIEYFGGHKKIEILLNYLIS